MIVFLLAHEGETHSPDLGVIVLVVAGAVLALMLVGRALRRR
jgi:hypothetical protein